MSSRDQRRASKRKRVDRTGPAESLGDMLDKISTFVGDTRRHAPGCLNDGNCHPDCETDEQLRARLVERLG